jgi:hypothetical protein
LRSLDRAQQHIGGIITEITTHLYNENRQETNVYSPRDMHMVYRQIKSSYICRQNNEKDAMPDISVMTTNQPYDCDWL